jgi:hypothetical protein
MPLLYQYIPSLDLEWYYAFLQPNYARLLSLNLHDVIVDLAAEILVIEVN